MQYSIYSCDMVWALELQSPASCNTPVPSIHSICLNHQSKTSKISYKKIKPPQNRIELPEPTYSEPRVKRFRLGIQP